MQAPCLRALQFSGNSNTSGSSFSNLSNSLRRLGFSTSSAPGQSAAAAAEGKPAGGDEAAPGGQADAGEAGPAGAEGDEAAAQLSPEQLALALEEATAALAEEKKRVGVERRLATRACVHGFVCCSLASAQLTSAEAGWVAGGGDAGAPEVCMCVGGVDGGRGTGGSGRAA